VVARVESSPGGWQVARRAWAASGAHRDAVDPRPPPPPCASSRADEWVPSQYPLEIPLVAWECKKKKKLLDA
jgi:hypothetical protein